MFRKQSQILSNTEEVIKCGNIVDLERHTEEIQANQASNQCAEIPNLIILACKHNKIETLKFLFAKNGEVLNGTTIRPYDLDDSNHNAFYYAIRSGNMDLLKTLITEWPGLPFSNNLEALDDILSQAYDELKLKNIPLSEETIKFVESQLIDLRFFSNSTSSTQHHLTNIIKRIKLVVENIDLLSAEYSNDQEIDERFLFIAKCIAQNIFVLKKQLGSTYKTLPWEEIEFCLIRFTLAHIKKHKNNNYYYFILDTTKLLKYLNLFSQKLKEEQTNFESIGIDVRKLAVAEEPNQKPEFKDLYNDYQQIRDIHSLSKMRQYIELSLAIDPNGKEGKLVIKRTLMVMGEHTKNTKESPKLSEDTQNLLLFSLSSKTKTILKGIRNSLAHTPPNIEDNGDVNFFIGIQKDCEQLRGLIDDVLYKRKTDLLKSILKEIANEDNYDRITKLSKILIYWKDEILKVNPRRNFDRIKNLFENLHKVITITHPLDYEINIIGEVYQLFQSEKLNLLTNRKDIITAYENLIFCDHLEENSKIFKFFKNYHAQELLEAISPNEINEVNLLTQIDKHCFHIYESLSSRMQTDTREFEEICKLILNIKFISSFGTNNLKSIKEFEKKCKENKKQIKNNSTQTKDVFSKEQLDAKLVDLRQDLVSLLNSPKGSEFQAVVEELVFGMLTFFITYKTCELENNFLSIDDKCPLLIGRSLRNHLAHDNALVDLLTSDPTISIVLNAKKLITEDLTSTTGRKKLGRTLPEDIARVTNNYHCGLEIISNQKEMFSAFRNGNFMEFRCCLREGADVFGRCSRMRTALHYASMGGSLDIVKYLFDQNVLADAKDTQGKTILHIASEYGRSDIVKYLLENKKVFKDELTERKETALHLAAEKGHTKIVELLLDYKASVNIQNVSSLIPLQTAIIHNQKHVVDILLREEKEEAVNSLLLLHLASASGNLVMVEHLINNGVHINDLDKDKFTPLHVAAKYGHLVVVNFLIENNAEVNPKENHGRVPLHFAAIYGHVTVVETLIITHCAQINVVDDQKLTPLHLAILGEHENVVNIFLKNGAETDLTNVTDQPLLHMAVFSGNLTIINALLKKGVEINLRNGFGGLPLHVLASTNHSNASAIAEVLIRKGADIDSRDRVSNTPLHLAATPGNTELIKYLVKHGADVNAYNCDSLTPLHYAVDKNNLEAVKFLVKNGALINEKDKSGLTPFLLAADREYIEIVEYFLENKVREDKNTESNKSLLGKGILHGNYDLVKVLLKHKSQINKKIISNGLALISAIEVGKKDIVEILIKNGACVDLTNLRYGSPLRRAITLNRMEIIELLVSKGANVDGESGKPIVEAVNSGFNDIVEYLLQKKASLNPDVLGEDTSLLNCAVCKRHKNVVSTLIKYGTDVKASSSKGWTVLHTSVREGYNDITKILIENGADVNAKSDFGTPLHIAVEKNNLECVNTLINTGKANMEIKANNDYTALHIAAEKGYIEMVENLVNNGSDINANNASGFKAIHIAAKHGFKNIVEFFLNKGLSVDERDINNNTPLHLTSIDGHLKVVQYLISENADLNAQDFYGRTPLHYAANSGNENAVELFLHNGAMYNTIDSGKAYILEHTSRSEIVDVLLKNKANPNAVDINGFTALHYAVHKESTNIVRILLENGAYIAQMTIKGNTALHTAALRNNLEIVEILLQHASRCGLNEFIDAKTTNSGSTALHVAAKNNSLDIIKSLLKNGAVYDAKNQKGEVPSSLSNDQHAKSFLKRIESLFGKVKSGNSEAISILEILNTNDFLAATKTRNKEGLTLLQVAIKNKRENIAKELVMFLRTKK